MALAISSRIHRVKESMENISWREGLNGTTKCKENLDELAQLSNAFDVFVDNLDRNFKIVAKATQNLSSDSQDLQSVSQATLSNVETQDVETQNIATSMSQLSASVLEITGIVKPLSVLKMYQRKRKNVSTRRRKRIPI